MLLHAEYILGAKIVRETRVSETHNDGRPVATMPRTGDAISVRQFPVLLWRLLRNPAFMCVAFAGASMGLVTVSVATFLPKYIQNIYGTTASAAATYAGTWYPYILCMALKTYTCKVSPSFPRNKIKSTCVFC